MTKPAAFQHNRVQGKEANRMSIQLETMPKLGFGLMRLPEKEGKIDIGQVSRMVDTYMKAGMNYS